MRVRALKCVFGVLESKEVHQEAWEREERLGSGFLASFFIIQRYKAHTFMIVLLDILLSSYLLLSWSQMFHFEHGMFMMI